MALINTTTTGILGTTLFGDGAGALTVQQDGVTINKITAVPTFSAIRTGGSGSNVSVPANTWTKIPFNGFDFDTNNIVNTTTGLVLPTVAGYYSVTIAAYINYSSSAMNRIGLRLYKNGTTFKGDVTTGTTAYYGMWSVNSIVYCNGTTDYLEMYAFQATSSDCTVLASGTYTYMSGSLVRAA
jgi:hypothetical protein